MKLAVLVDSDQTIARWQFNALQEVISDGHEINILATAKGNAPKSRKKIKHIFYYVFAILNRYKLAQLNRVSIHDLGLQDALQVDFEREIKGMWEEIPANSLSRFSESDVVVKFGMGLLRNPHLIPAKYGVLSYHHGDPKKYRGRPAGLWESLDSERSMGVIVQSLSNNLDAGEIKAIGFSRVNQTSYRKTLSEVYATGTPLLRKALNNLASSSSIASSFSKKATTLPSNAKVIQLFIKQFKNRVARYAYGAFVEKKWRVGHLSLLVDLENHSTIKVQELELIPVPPGYMMTADPCGELLDGLYCELLNNKSGLGEIAIWKHGNWHHLDIGISGHASYPQIVQWNNSAYLFPEVSLGSSPVLIELGLDGNPSGNKIYLKNLEDKKLVDGTLFESNGSWFLFAGRIVDSYQRLELYYSTSLDADFYTHPMSPIVLDPGSSRMAGPIVQKDDSIYRLGQDCSEKYGSGIAISRVSQLTPNNYREERVGSLGLEGALGPHSLLISKDKIWLDFYTENFAFGASFRRIKAKFF